MTAVFGRLVRMYAGPGMIGRERHETLGADRVARVEHGDVRLGAAHRQIFERHLRGPVFADRDAGVRSRHLDADVADRRHADEIGAARQKAGKRRGKRNRAARRQSHRRSQHRLLGDEVLVEAIRKRLFELVAEGRVLHVGIERDDALVGLAELGERDAVGLAGRDLIAQLVGRRRHRLRRWRLGGTRGRLGNLPRQIDRVARGRHLRFELGERAIELFALLERSSVPAVLAFRERDAFTLDGAGDDHRRLTLDASALRRRHRESRSCRGRR